MSDNDELTALIRETFSRIWPSSDPDIEQRPLDIDVLFGSREAMQHQHAGDLASQPRGGQHPNHFFAAEPEGFSRAANRHKYIVPKKCLEIKEKFD